MKKKLKKWGNSMVVVFTKEECELYKLVEGDTIDLDDIIDLDDMLVQKQKKEGKKDGRNNE